MFYGSPGLELDNPSQLGLPNGHAFVMKAPPGDDWIPEVAPLAALHGWGSDPYGGMMPNCRRKPVRVPTASSEGVCTATPTTRARSPVREASRC